MDARSRILQERLSSRKTLFSSLVSRSANTGKIHAEFARRRAELDTDEKRFEATIRALPETLRALHAEIEALESATMSEEDREILALFGDGPVPKLPSVKVPVHTFSSAMLTRIMQEWERDNRERSPK